MGAFGAALKNKELHQSYCYDCGQPTLTRSYGKILCTHCREQRGAVWTAARRAREALDHYWMHIGLLGVLSVQLVVAAIDALS